MNYREKYAEEIAGQFHDLENRIMSDIIRRIVKEEKITSTADWQINRLTSLGYSSEDIEAQIKDALNSDWPEMFELYDEVVNWEYVRNKKIYEQINGEFIPYEDNKQLQQFVEAARLQTKDALTNITKTMGIVSNINGQLTFLPLTEFTRRELDAAVMDIASGAFDYNSVLKRTVQKLTNSGVRTIDYANGYTSRITVAARRAVMTGVSQLTGQISDMNADKLGTEYFEVEWHEGARPSHREWQGKVYTKEELVTICGLGTVTGLKGANCYHEYYPFFPGISERNWTDEWLEEKNRQEATQKTYKGKEYDAYEAKQKCRDMEVSMRAQRQKVRLMEKGKADKEDIIIEKARYQGQLAEYKEFCSAMDLEPEMERVYIDGLGRIAYNGNMHQRTFAKSRDSGIIKPSKMYRKRDNTSVEPMPKKQLQKIVKAFKRKGGIIQMDEATDAYLEYKKAEAITYNDKTILLRRNPGRAAVFEELIHATQYRNGKNDGSAESILICEIEAQEKLLKYQKAYKLTEDEIQQTEKALKYYRNKLKKLKGGG